MSGRSAAGKPRAGWSGPGAVASLAGLGAVHAAWARGSAWPFADRARLAAAVVGVGESEFPSPGLTRLVSAGLLGASALVAAQAWGPDPVRRLTRPGAAAAGAAFTVRGVVGLVGPQRLPAGELPPFRRLNTFVYSPFCLGLGATIAHSLRRPDASRPPR